MLQKILKKIVVIGKYSLLPILTAIYPIIFHYTNNISNLGILPFSQLGNLFTIMILIAVAVFALFYLFSRGQDLLASIAGFIFVIFFNIYGILFVWLRGLDKFQMDHYLFLPFYALFAIYLAWVISTQIIKKYGTQFWNFSIIIVGSLLLFNLIKIVPVEFKKIEARNSSPQSTSVIQNPTEFKNSPDIYFIILDEFAGFDAMRNYFKYSEIDTFKEFLISKGFFIAENSHADVPSTLPEISSRLNYEVISAPEGDLQTYYDAIDHNKVMQFLKERGYSTIVMDGLYYAWSTQQSVQADYSFTPTDAYKGGFLNNEFEVLVLKNTMILPFLYNEKQDDPVAVRNRSMISYTLSHVSQIAQIPSPKFVYIHLMLPHAPFLFSATGKPLDPQYYMNWDDYLGNYIYATSVIHDYISTLLASSDPEHPPVIILQSDHGARNGPDGYTNYLENYPEEYRTLILNAFHLPGCDTSKLSQDINPINTFPVVFNCYFNANIPLK
jgi:hypothetical protein